MKRIAIFTVVILAVALGCGESAKLDAKLEPLDAPSKTVTIESLKGKVVLIDFWATWCGPCQMTMPTIQDLYTKYKDKGFTVAGVTQEDRPTVEKFLRHTPFDYPIYLDGLGQANRDFGVTSIPFAVLIGRNGNVVAKHLGAPLDPDQLGKEIEEALGR